MKLHHRKLGQGEPIIILHGVFGSSDNWQSVGKVLANNWEVYLVDQRNHGLSPHSDVFDYPTMADDIAELITREQLGKVTIVGHSMGGKVAMHLVSSRPDLVKKLVVVDIAPRYYLPHHQKIFEGFHAVDLTAITSRKEAETLMSGKITDFGVRQFILKNLARTPEGKFQWKINLKAIEDNIEAIGQGVPDQLRFDGPTLFIKGEKSDYITSEDASSLKHHFPESRILVIQNAGHWVHAEQPQAMLDGLNAFLNE